MTTTTINPNGEITSTETGDLLGRARRVVRDGLTSWSVSWVDDERGTLRWLGETRTLEGAARKVTRRRVLAGQPV